ncbi:MAG: hypothetical protein ACXADH_13480 [Candidatus Kariarchaeaceae archaeon]|jgi:hypothetical protein
MTTFTKVILSGSTNGRPINITSTTTGGDTVHTADSTAIDEVWLYAVNSSISTAKLTIEFGGTTDPDDRIELGVSGESGLVLVAPGLPLTNSLVVTAFSDTTAAINIVGWVNRIS